MRLDVLNVTGASLSTAKVPPGIGSKVPNVVYDGSGDCSGMFYLEDGTAVAFKIALQPEETRELAGVYLKIASRLYSLLGKGG